LVTPEIAPDDSGSKPRFTLWHGATAALLALGYSGYYFCRSDLSVVLPDLMRDLSRHGITPNQAQIRLGFMASMGTAAYALGKFFSGALADTKGGRRFFLGGMAGSIFFTIVFALSGGFPIFTLAWIGNRLFQSQGWAGLVRVSSRWFSYSTYGSVMAVVSLSFLFGDAGCRWMMSELLAHGVGWRGVFYFAAAALGVLFLINLVLLRETPAQRGLPAPEVNPRNVYAQNADAQNVNMGDPSAEHHHEHQQKIGAILRPLLSSFAFWLVCLLAFGATLLRETFNLWTPTYFVQFVGLLPSVAASRSALFPLCGGVSVLLGGFLSDKLGANGRNVLVVAGMSACTVCLVMLGRVPGHAGESAPSLLVGLVGFTLLGPYSYLAGAMSLDFGGQQGSATAAGIIDGFGYIAGWLSGVTVARISVAYGWSSAFFALAGVSLATALVALILTAHHRNDQLRNP
jgi:sugar phosphate permease